MAPLGYVEILDGKGGVVERFPVIESFPIKIGRAYDNDVILSDPYVCSDASSRSRRTSKGV